MFKNVGAITESDKIKGGFAPFKKGEYILTVQEAELGETFKKMWVGGMSQPTDEKEPQLTLKFSVSKPDGSDVYDEDGRLVMNPKYRFWVTGDKERGNLGWKKGTKDPKQGRGLITALMGLPAEAPLEEILNNPNSLVFKECLVYLGVETTKTGTKRNAILSIDPIKKN